LLATYALACGLLGRNAPRDREGMFIDEIAALVPRTQRNAARLGSVVRC